MNIQEGNKLIAEFMGAEVKGNWVHLKHRVWGYQKKNYPGSLKYNSNWDWIMAACYKFDNLDTSRYDRLAQSEYQNLCDQIDMKVILYEIMPVWTALTEAILWYNTQQH